MVDKFKVNMPIRIQPKPFVKWAGGKRSIVNTLLENIPKEYNTYYELFAGGGALYWSLYPKKAFIGDWNIDLILTYKAIKDDVKSLIERLEIHKQNHSKNYYYLRWWRVHERS